MDVTIRSLPYPMARGTGTCLCLCAATAVRQPLWPCRRPNKRKATCPAASTYCDEHLCREQRNRLCLRRTDKPLPVISSSTLNTPRTWKSYSIESATPLSQPSVARDQHKHSASVEADTGISMECTTARTPATYLWRSVYHCTVLSGQAGATVGFPDSTCYRTSMASPVGTTSAARLLRALILITRTLRCIAVFRRS